jgi:formate hydrogenlyase subunit 4
MAYAIGAGILNVLVVLGLSPLYEGLARKFVRARVHSRQGPPVRQPYFDLLKLLGKEDLRVSDSPLLSLAPKLCLAAVVAAGLLVPMGLLVAPLSGAGDVILFIYLIGLAAVAVVLGAAASESPYASVGLGREVMLLLTVEPVVAVALLTAAVKAQSLQFTSIIAWHNAAGATFSLIIAAIAFFAALLVQGGRLPFDTPEADQEIMGGPFIEQSGPKLALFKWSLWAKQLVFAAVLAQVFIPWPVFDLTGGVGMALGVIVTLVKVGVIWALASLIDVVHPRVRIDQALHIFLALLIVAGVGLAFAIMGF